MSKRLIVSKLMIPAIALMSLSVSQARMPAQSGSVKISQYRDDPFVAESYVGRMDASRIGEDDRGRILSGNRVSLIEESAIFRKNSATGQFERFAWNPWPALARSNENGNFKFADEPRFPLHEVERDAEGKPVLKDGLQVWKPRILHLGNTTTFAASHAVIDAAEFWAGRDIPWGQNNILEVEPHAFIEFNAFYGANTRTLHFGVVPYRLPGETQIKMFETATSWEIVAHESGHAMHSGVKPHRLSADTWAESFADQAAMWSSLLDPQRVRNVLAETSGNLQTSNSLTRLGEAFAALTGRGTSVRDAFNDLKISDTTTEIHDRSRVFTGAAYKVFTLIYDRLRSEQGLGERAAVTEAGAIMGTFLTYSTDYSPERLTTLEDAGKAYLKVDKELFGGRYHAMLVDEFIRREIFDADSVTEWMAHEAAAPELRLPQAASDRKVNRLLQANLENLGIGPDFGLKLKSVTRERRFGQTIVRVQLTEGRGEDAPVLDNYGLLTFRGDGTLADYHSPLPPEDGLHVLMQAQAETRALMDEAKRLHIDRRGAPLSIVRRPDGQLTVEARVIRSEGINYWIEVFTLENPHGERREVITREVPYVSGYQPNGVQILTVDDLRN